MFHSTAYVNGTVYTMESEGNKCSAFVVQDGKFVYCGSDGEANVAARARWQTARVPCQI